MWPPPLPAVTSTGQLLGARLVGGWPLAGGAWRVIGSGSKCGRRRRSGIRAHWHAIVWALAGRSGVGTYRTRRIVIVVVGISIASSCRRVEVVGLPPVSLSSFFRGQRLASGLLVLGRCGHVQGGGRSQELLDLGRGKDYRCPLECCRWNEGMIVVELALLDFWKAIPYIRCEETQTSEIKNQNVRGWEWWLAEYTQCSGACNTRPAAHKGPATTFYFGDVEQ